METTKNRYLITHVAIIRSLLDGSKKSQNQIAKETNYEKSTISHALDYLEKKKVIIRETTKKESGYTNKGNYKNKLCQLSYEVDNGIHVLEFLRDILKLKESASLIPLLQNSDKIINLIYSNLVFKIGSVEEFKKKTMLSKKYFEVHLICNFKTPPQNQWEYTRSIVAMHNTAAIFFSTIYRIDYNIDKMKSPDILFYACVFYDYLTFDRPNPYDDLNDVTKEYLDIDLNKEISKTFCECLR